MEDERTIPSWSREVRDGALLRVNGRAVAGLHVLGGFTKPFCTGVLLVGGAVSSNYGAEDSCVSP